METVIIALIAVFLGFRLYSVLGKRTGHEQSFTPPPMPATVPPHAAPVAEVEARKDMPMTETATSGVRALISAEPGFDVDRFLGGARSAYRTILEAYWAGDAAEVRKWSRDHVADDFANAIAARQDAGHSLENRLISIDHATITNARVEHGEALVTVAFDATVAAVTRDRDGQVIAGSMSDAAPTHDVWTFAKPLRSQDPNWFLVETDESA